MSIYHFGAEWGDDRTRYSFPKILVIEQAPPAKEQLLKKLKNFLS